MESGVDASLFPSGCVNCEQVYKRGFKGGFLVERGVWFLGCCFNLFKSMICCVFVAIDSICGKSRANKNKGFHGDKVTNLY